MTSLLAARDTMRCVLFISAMGLSAGEAMAAGCPSGEVAIGADCVAVDTVAAGLRTIVEESIARADLNAVLLSVRIGDTPVLTEAWGESMTGVPATTDMHFRNGAVAIAYLATVLLQLGQEGVLSLDDTLAKWFPGYPRADAITLRMLIASTSGYADYVDLDLLPLHDDPFRQWTPEELVAIGLGQPMKCDPGACFAYAHTNFVILGEVLAKATGKPVARLIEERILAPLGLENTRSEATPVIQSPVLHAYSDERGQYEETTFWNPSWTLARGAIMTTDIADLLASAIAVGSGSLLSPESHAAQLALQEPVTPPFREELHFGLGVLVVNSWALQTPSFAGYSAAMAYLPQGRVAVAAAATMGRKTPETPRPTDVLFGKIAAYLTPDHVPDFSR